uniref:Uncharacterized protein n=1 Tax=Mola mola TaxID=94237 RepID=A0A3Q3WX56_MOLML
SSTSSYTNSKICSLGRNDDDDDDKKRRSSFGAKMMGMVGLGKKSQSASQLNPEGHSHLISCYLHRSMTSLQTPLPPQRRRGGSSVGGRRRNLPLRPRRAPSPARPPCPCRPSPERQHCLPGRQRPEPENRTAGTATG